MYECYFAPIPDHDDWLCDISECLLYWHIPDGLEELLGLLMSGYQKSLGDS